MTWHMSIEELESLHGHEGRTRLHWIDKQAVVPNVVREGVEIDIEATFGEYLTVTGLVSDEEKATFDVGVLTVTGHPEGLVGKRRQIKVFQALVTEWCQLTPAEGAKLVGDVLNGISCHVCVKPGRSAWEFHRKALALGFEVLPGRQEEE
jgi:hypothetical protein